MKYKVSELEGPLLDAAVAKAEGCLAPIPGTESGEWLPGQNLATSSDWTSGGPIIERERIDIRWWGGSVCAASTDDLFPYFQHSSVLVAAMRAYVYGKLGNEIDL